jgi:hypothetical protein
MPPCSADTPFHHRIPAPDQHYEKTVCRTICQRDQGSRTIDCGVDAAHRRCTRIQPCVGSAMLLQAHTCCYNTCLPVSSLLNDRHGSAGSTVNAKPCVLPSKRAMQAATHPPCMPDLQMLTQELNRNNQEQSLLGPQQNFTPVSKKSTPNACAILRNLM